MNRDRVVPLSAGAAVLAALVVVAYMRTWRHELAGEWPGSTQRSPQPGRPGSVPAFVEVGPDQYKPTSAAIDAEIELAIRRLARDGREADAEALRRYLQERLDRSA